MISFDLSLTTCCPKIRPFSVAHAPTVWSIFRPFFWLPDRLSALPSMAMISSPQDSRNVLIQSTILSVTTAGSTRLNTRPNVSCDGTPCCSVRNRRSHDSCSSAIAAIPSQSSPTQHANEGHDQHLHQRIQSSPPAHAGPKRRQNVPSSSPSHPLPCACPPTSARNPPIRRFIPKTAALDTRVFQKPLSRNTLWTRFGAFALRSKLTGGRVKAAAR